MSFILLIIQSNLFSKLFFNSSVAFKLDRRISENGVEKLFALIFLLINKSNILQYFWRLLQKT